MKKITLIFAVTLCISMAAACGGKSGSAAGTEGQNGQSGALTESAVQTDTEDTSVAADAQTLLTSVWQTYAEDEKFSVIGGDASEANTNTDGPGKYSIDDAQALDSAIGFPAAEIAKIDDAASLVHMMNANTFTGGAFHVASASDVETVAASVKENIMGRQWLCGFPDKVTIMTVGDYIVAAFGAADLVDTFAGKVQTVYPTAVVYCDEAIA